MGIGELAIQFGDNIQMSATASSGRSRRAHATSAASPVLVEMLSSSGYTEIRSLNDQLCAVKQFNYTTALVVGLDDVGYQRRYCYEHRADAQAALLGWDGREHPPGPWIKCKGGGIDLLNPAFC